MKGIFYEGVALVVAILLLTMGIIYESSVYHGHRTAEIYHSDGTYSTVDITRYRVKGNRIILTTINGYEWDLPQEEVEVTKE